MAEDKKKNGCVSVSLSDLKKEMNRHEAMLDSVEQSCIKASEDNDRMEEVLHIMYHSISVIMYMQALFIFFSCIGCLYYTITYCL